MARRPAAPDLLQRTLSANTRYLEITRHGPGDDIVAVAQAPNLREFLCNGPKLGKPSLAAVIGHPQLEFVHFEAIPTVLADVPTPRNSRLKTLSITFPSLAQQSWADDPSEAYQWLRGCTRLTEIHVRGSDHAFLAQVGRYLQGAEKLVITADDAPDIDSLTEWAKLRHLTIDRCRLHESGLVSIGHALQQLESLEVLNEGFMLTCDGIKSLQKLPQLKRLGLEQCALKQEHIDVIATLAQLEELSLYGNELDDESLAPLAKLSHLKKLDLEGTQASPTLYANIRGSWKVRYRGW